VESFLPLNQATHHFILKMFAANQNFNCYLPVILFVDCVEHFSNWSSFTDKIAWCLVLLVWYMVFNTTFNNISIIPWQSVLLVENRCNQRKTSICHKSLKTEYPEKTTLSRITKHGPPHAILVSDWPIFLNLLL
jgi:hypothetical protein